MSSVHSLYIKNLHFSFCTIPHHCSVYTKVVVYLSNKHKEFICIVKQNVVFFKKNLKICRSGVGVSNLKRLLYCFQWDFMSRIHHTLFLFSYGWGLLYNAKYDLYICTKEIIVQLRGMQSLHGHNLSI